MLPGTIATIDHRVFGDVGGNLGQTLHGMTHDDNIYIAIDGLNSVGQRFTFGLGRGTGTSHGNNPAPTRLAADSKKAGYGYWAQRKGWQPAFLPGHG